VRRSGVKGRLSASNALLALIALLNLLSAATLAQPVNLPPALVYDTLTHNARFAKNASTASRRRRVVTTTLPWASTP
jgi:hypothetical protein